MPLSRVDYLETIDDRAAVRPDILPEAFSMQDAMSGERLQVLLTRDAAQAAWHLHLPAAVILDAAVHARVDRGARDGMVILYVTDITDPH